MMMKKSLRVQGIVSVCLAILFCGAAMGAQKVIEWKFDGDLADTSGNGLDGIAFGTPAYTSGVSGQAFVSDGTNCVYRTGISTALLPVLAADTWSVNVWVYPTENPRDWRVLWCLGEKPDASKNSRAVYASGFADFGGLIAFVGRTTTATTYISTMIPWDINQWQMITTTYDGQIVRIYKNGVLIAMRNQTFLDAPGEVRIPSNPWNSYDFFIGRFDEFTVWRGVLTAEEIRNLIIPGILAEVPTTRQVAYYKMENPSGFVMPDYSGLGNNGQLWGYTDPISEWLADGFRGDALLFDGGQKIDLPFSVSQPVNYTVSFWFKSGEQPYWTAFYSEKQMSDPGGGLAKGTQFLIRANNGELQVISKERDYNTLFLIKANAAGYLDGKTWHHLAVVADGEAAKATLYLDGQEFASADYFRSSHKTRTLSAAIGYSWADDGFLGEWGEPYIDEVTIWNGALTPAQIQALAARSNLNSDQVVGMVDAAAVSEDWMEDTVLVPGDLLAAEDMEGTLDRWSVYASPRYSGTGTISQTSNAYAGNSALQWDYVLPATTPADPNNYTSILYDFGQVKDLSGCTKVSLRMYRHKNNSEEDILFLKFLNEAMQVKAEQWIQGIGATVQPINHWTEWAIDPNSLRGPNGVGTAYEKHLTDIRYILIGVGSSDQTQARSGRIDIDEFKFIIREPVCSAIPLADLNKDCRVDLDDLFILVEEWLLGIQ
ncbi:MAG: LamG domain-containing protein [Anaerohalosphaeraceae bacterium]